MNSKEKELVYAIKTMKKLNYPDGEILKKYEASILQLRNLELLHFFAINIIGADIKQYGQVILESKDPKYNYLFARDVKE